MKIYILYITGDNDYDVISCEDDIGFDVLLNYAGSYPSHRIKYIASECCGYSCYAILKTYDMKDMNRDEMERLTKNILEMYDDIEDYKHKNIYIRYSDEWQPDIDYDPNDKRLYLIDEDAE
jgi:ABC-type nitrate/sulfonate/bicarbonate transport system substrate-binding protein